VVSDYDVRSSLRLEPHGRAAPNPPLGARWALLPTPSRPASEQAWANIRSTHHFTKDWVHTAAAGLNAGLDQEGGGTRVIAQLEAAVAANLTTVAHVQAAFRRLMRVRIQLGMLDPPTTVGAYNALGRADLQTAAATALNRRAAAAGMVLLKNGADPSLGSNEIGMASSCVHASVDHNEPDALRLLLKYGAPHSAPGKGGFTPLALAARVGAMSVMPPLLEAGADSDAPTGAGKTARELAVINKKTKAIELFDSAAAGKSA